MPDSTNPKVLATLPFSTLLDLLSAAEHVDVCARVEQKKAIRREIELRYSFALFDAVDNDKDGRPSKTESIGDIINREHQYEINWYRSMGADR